MKTGCSVLLGRSWPRRRRFVPLKGVFDGLIEAHLPTFDQRFLIGRLAQPGTYLGSGARSQERLHAETI